jgi:hypothetical protein
LNKPPNAKLIGSRSYAHDCRLHIRTCTRAKRDEMSTLSVIHFVKRRLRGDFYLPNGQTSGVSRLVMTQVSSAITPPTCR